MDNCINFNVLAKRSPIYDFLSVRNAKKTGKLLTKLDAAKHSGKITEDKLLSYNLHDQLINKRRKHYNRDYTDLLLPEYYRQLQNNKNAAKVMSTVLPVSNRTLRKQLDRKTKEGFNILHEAFKSKPFDPNMTAIDTSEAIGLTGGINYTK